MTQYKKTINFLKSRQDFLKKIKVQMGDLLGRKVYSSRVNCQYCSLLPELFPVSVQDHKAEVIPFPSGGEASPSQGYFHLN